MIPISVKVITQRDEVISPNVTIIGIPQHEDVARFPDNQQKFFVLRIVWEMRVPFTGSSLNMEFLTPVEIVVSEA